MQLERELRGWELEHQHQHRHRDQRRHDERHGHRDRHRDRDRRRAELRAHAGDAGVLQSPELLAFSWNGEACVYVEGCNCAGPDCDALFTFEPDFIGSDSPRNKAEHDCWSTYIDIACMTDPCDCPAGEYCVGYYDGTCQGGWGAGLSCTPMPMGCEDDPKDCQSDCPEQICGTGNPCNASPCGGEWSNAIYCYGI